MRIEAGTSNNSAVVRFVDSTSYAPASQVVSTTAGLYIWYRRQGGTVTEMSAINLAAADSAHSDGGLIHLQDGYYRVDPPDAAFGSGATDVLVGGSATGFLAVADRIVLDTISLTNIRAEASGALNTYDAPTNAEFEARTLAASDIFLFGTDPVMLQGATASQINTLITNVPDVISLANIRIEASGALGVYDAPTNAEFEARTLAGSDIFLFGTDPVMLQGATASQINTLITNVPDVISLANIRIEASGALGVYDAPTNAEFEARTLAGSDIFLFGTDPVMLQGATASQINTLITNVPDVISLANIRAEASGALNTYDSPTNAEFEARTLAASDIFLFGTDRVMLLGDTASQIDNIETNASAISVRVPDTVSLANIRAEASGALNTYDGPTNTEMNARTIVAANYFDPAADTVMLQGATASQINNIETNASAISDRVPDTISLNNIGSQSSESLSAIGLQFLLNDAVAGANVADNSVVAQIVSSSAQADWDTFVNTTESLQAIRDRGDAAWIAADVNGLATSTNVPDIISLTNIRAEASGALDTYDAPTNTEFEARTLAASDIFLFGTDRVMLLGDTASQIDNIEASVPDTISLANIRAEASGALDTYDAPTNAEMEARTLAASDIFLFGTDPVMLQGATASQINTLETNVPDVISLANVRAEASGALNTYDSPTNAEFEARTLAASDIFLFGTDRVMLLNDTASQIDNIETNASALSNRVPDTVSLNNIGAQSSESLSAIGLQFLLNEAVAGANVADNSVMAQVVSGSAQADWDTFDNTTDSLEVIAGAAGLTTSQVRIQIDEGLSAIGLDHLVSVAVVGADVTDNSIIAKITSSSAQADWDTFANADDSLQAISEAGAAGLTTSAVRTQVDEGLSAIGLDHLLSVAVVGADVTDNTVIAKITSSSAQADWDTFVNTTESLQALRDQGDAAWIAADVNGLATSTNVPDVISLANIRAEASGALGVYDSPTNAEFEARTLAGSDIFLFGTDAVMLQGATASQINTLETNVPDIISLANIRAEASGALDTYDSPTNTEFEARTLAASDIFLFGTDSVMLQGATASQINALETNVPDVISLANIRAEASGALDTYDGPTNTEMNARTIVAADYFDPTADTVMLQGATASQINTIETNVPDVISLTNIRAEASGALNTYDSPTNAEFEARTLAGSDIFLFGTDPVMLQGATASQIDTLETNVPDVISLANIRAEASGALDTYDAPTNAEFEARTLAGSDIFLFGTDPVMLQGTTASQINTIETGAADIQSRVPAGLSAGSMITSVNAIDGAENAATRLKTSVLTVVSGAATAHQLSTTQMSTNLTEATDDHYNGRIVIWTAGNLQDQATDITDFTGWDGTSSLMTFTAITEAPADADSFIIV